MHRFKSLYDGSSIESIGLGTWRMGGEGSPDYQRDKELVTAIRQAVELGYSHIDTAEFYGSGHTEELVGQAVSGADRERLFITTKVWYTHLEHNAVLEAIEASLKRLGMDYVDMYLIHWPNERIPIEETMRGMNEALRRGYTRYIGVSNFDVKQLEQASRLAEKPLATNQVPYSIRQREYVQNGVLKYCQEHDILLTAYSPIDVGRAANNRMVKKVAAKYGASPVQTALGWLIQQKNVIAIPKAANPKHLEENLGAYELVLQEDDWEALEQMG
jgi:diketogulonate reductase-like aldo/keto reductase